MQADYKCMTGNAKLPALEICIKEANIIDDNGILKLRCEPAMIDDLKDMHGIDICNAKLLETVKAHGSLTIKTSRC